MNVKQAAPFFPRFEHGGWLQLEGAALMLQEFRKEEHDSWMPKGNVGEGVSICFQCKDALAIDRDVTSRGIKGSRPFVGQSDRCAGFE